MNLPQTFKIRMKNMLGQEYDDFERALEEKDIFRGVRVFRAKNGAREAVLHAAGELSPVPWCGAGYYADKSVLSGKHPYHAAGLFYFQEPSAMAAVEALDIQKHDYVLDLCAAPGGKATQAADYLSGTGLLVANEIDRRRSFALAENIERFGITNALVTNETPERLAERFEGFFDKIIVDAPCSGEGMFRKEPQAVSQWSEEYTRVCAERDKEIADCAVRMLRAGGKMVYSTCTFAPCENEGIAEYILNTYMDMTLLPISHLSMLSPGCGDYIGSPRDFSAARRIFPHKQNGEGHFIALFEKSGGVCSREKEDIRELRIDILPYREFEKNTLKNIINGNFVLFGDELYRLPNGINSIDGLRVVRAGLHMGTYKKGRFEPSHALALALSPTGVQRCLDFPHNSIEMQKYMRGEILPCDAVLSGWTLVSADGFSIGWGKASSGTLKNHFPKYLRI